VTIIDDDPEMEMLYDLMLESLIDQKSISIKFFSNPLEFVEWFKTNTPDLVMTDINLPELSGIEISKIIQDSGRAVPVFLVSGYDESDYRNSIRELGIRRFLTKPLDYLEVIKLIAQELGIKHEGI